MTARWARRTPDAFTFHVKASAAMTWHDGEPDDASFRRFRASLEPLELSGKLRGVLLQYHPRFTKSEAAKAELARAPERLAPLGPLVEFRHRSWMEEDERADTLGFLERHGLAYVSVDAPATRASNVSPRVAAATGRVAYVRFHGRNVETWNVRGGSVTSPAYAARPYQVSQGLRSWMRSFGSWRSARSSGRVRGRSAADRFDWLYAADDLAEWVPRLAGLAEEAEEVYAMFNNNRDDFAPRSAQLLRGLLDEAGVQAAGGIEPPPRELTLF